MIEFRRWSTGSPRPDRVLWNAGRFEAACICRSRVDPPLRAECLAVAEWHPSSSRRNLRHPMSRIWSRTTPDCLVNNHPFACPTGIFATFEATSLAPTMFREGQQVDAFRHAYWMALLARDAGPAAAWSLGLAHEADQSTSHLDTQKDLINNWQGILIGLATDDIELTRELVVQAVNEGYLACRNGGNIVVCGS